MGNRIKNISIMNMRLEPTEAEVWISVFPESVTSGTQVHGRLVGPRCAYASTVEVAYAVREHAREYEKYGEPRITLRALIPEPCLWDTQSPFLYEVVLELRQGQDLCERLTVPHALCEWQLTPKGLKWNGKPLVLRGRDLTFTTEEGARALHQSGCRFVLVPAADASETQLALADRFGFVLLARVSSVGEQKHVTRHPSWLGVVLAPEILHHPLVHACGVWSLTREGVIGLELKGAPADPLPPGLSFVLCDESLLPELSGVDLPKLVIGREGSGHEGARLLGWITADAKPQAGIKA